MNILENHSDFSKEIIYSREVRSGRRIYYLDVKRSRPGDLFIAITESKKIVSGHPDHPDARFEKHKLFLYQEDIPDFVDALDDLIAYIAEQREQGENPDVCLLEDDLLNGNSIETLYDSEDSKDDWSDYGRPLSLNLD